MLKGQFNERQCYAIGYFFLNVFFLHLTCSQTFVTLKLHNWSCSSGQRERSLKPVLILDFWGPYTERWRVWLGWKNRCNAFMCFTLSWVALAESAHFFRGSVHFQQFFLCFFFQARDSITFTLHDLTDFYVERVTAHHITINYHSCFPIFWPNSKTKLKLKHLWEQGGPLMFRGPYAACVLCI